MKHYEAGATIAARPEQVWAILADGSSYTAWDSGIKQLEGTLGPGEKVTVQSNMGRGFPVRVTEFTPPERMTWTGGIPLGLFKGVRRFSLTPEGDATRFHVREEFSGPLLPLIWRTMPDLQPSFDQFVAGLKARAERS